MVNVLFEHPLYIEMLHKRNVSLSERNAMLANNGLSSNRIIMVKDGDDGISSIHSTLKSSTLKVIIILIHIYKEEEDNCEET